MHSYVVRAVSKEAPSKILGFKGPCNTRSFKDGPTIWSGDLLVNTVTVVSVSQISRMFC